MTRKAFTNLALVGYGLVIMFLILAQAFSLWFLVPLFVLFLPLTAIAFMPDSWWPWRKLK